MSQKVLSIFFDESGDQGVLTPHSPFYLLSMVFHDQSRDISEQIKKFDDHMCQLGLSAHAVHAGPLIRRESPYGDWLMEDRRKLFGSIFNFMRKARVNYNVIPLEKRKLFENGISVAKAIKNGLLSFIIDHSGLLNEYDSVIGYYDNGQENIARVIQEALGGLQAKVEMRVSRPSSYRLSQVADLVCTLELLRIKDSLGILTKSELDFFGSRKNLRKDYLKQYARSKI